MDIDYLVNLSSRAWALPILAELHRGTPGRQAALIAATGAGRTAFSQSLSHLVEMGLIARNPGHGHPLRPEFSLTPGGETAARMANSILSLEQLQKDRSLLRLNWSLPVLWTSRAPRYFGEIRSNLPKITDRALSSALKQLETHRWVRRRIEPDSRPPRALYQAINTGQKICSVLAETKLA